LLIAYVDDAGDAQGLRAGSQIQPVLAFACVIVNQADVAKLTRDFLSLKRHYFPGRLSDGRHRLSDILAEIKGAELRTMVRSPSRRKRRTALLYLRDVLQLLEGVDGRILGRVWVKVPDEPLDGLAMNTYSIQAMCRCFQKYLEVKGEKGIMVIDSSTPGLNARVAHSVFTQKFQYAGDSYSRILEMPTFGGSENHAGLQIADNIASGLMVPMATRAYCQSHVSGPHVHPNYDEITDRLGLRLRQRQYRYQNGEGTWTGGITVSDPVGHNHSGLLFRVPSSASLLA
jgi:Protein of unknown function (DUF3800)